MNKKQQMRWSGTTVWPLLEVRAAVLNDTLEDAFRLMKDNEEATATLS
jgi:hypothetical protein